MQPDSQDSRNITFCCTTLNRWHTLRYMIASLSGQSGGMPYELIITDFGSTDVSLRDVLTSMRYTTGIGVVAPPGTPFNRSGGLNGAARNIYARVGESRPDDILFFVDADIWLPPDFCSRIRQNVHENQAWFPICYSLYDGKPREVFDDEPPVGSLADWSPARANGWWREEGKGLCGFTLGDFKKVGGWDEQMGASYGGEDGDLLRRTEEHGIVIVRDREPGLFHLWHEPTRW